MDTEITDKKLSWRCRRGTKELDVVLGRFVKSSLGDLTADERRLFDQLLNTQDPLLTEWLCYGALVPAEYQKLVDKILSAGDG